MEPQELAAKVHEALEGRYELTGEDLYNIEYFLWELIKTSPKVTFTPYDLSSNGGFNRCNKKKDESRRIVSKGIWKRRKYSKRSSD
jgi:hypothetical protein